MNPLIPFHAKLKAKMAEIDGKYQKALHEKNEKMELYYSGKLSMLEEIIKLLEEGEWKS